MTPRGDDGVTLVELLVAMMIGALVSAVIAGAFTVGIRTTDATNRRLAGSKGAQIATALFPGDVQSAVSISGASVTCNSTTQTIATLTWTDTDAAGVAKVHTAQYVCKKPGSQQQLVRILTVGAATPTEAILVYDVTTAGVACTPNCTTPNSATLTVQETGGYQFSVTGSRRLA